MKTFLKWLLYPCLVYLIIAGQLLIFLILPAPFDNLNLVILTLVWLSFFLPLENILVWSVVAGFLLELFTALPFGIIFFALPMTIFVVSRFMMRFFTNRSLLIVCFIGLFSVVIYRLIFLGLVLVGNVLFFSIPLNGREFWMNAGWEAVLTTVPLVILYLVSSRFTARLKSQYVDLERIYY